jgi:hypothetical protein
VQRWRACQNFRTASMPLVSAREGNSCAWVDVSLGSRLPGPSFDPSSPCELNPDAFSCSSWCFTLLTPLVDLKLQLGSFSFSHHYWQKCCTSAFRHNPLFDLHQTTCIGQVGWVVVAEPLFLKTQQREPYVWMSVHGLLAQCLKKWKSCLTLRSERFKQNHNPKLLLWPQACTSSSLFFSNLSGLARTVYTVHDRMHR